MVLGLTFINLKFEAVNPSVFDNGGGSSVFCRGAAGGQRRIIGQFLPALVRRDGDAGKFGVGGGVSQEGNLRKVLQPKGFNLLELIVYVCVCVRTCSACALMPNAC